MITSYAMRLGSLLILCTGAALSALAAPTVTLSATPNPAQFGSPVVMTASVTPSSSTGLVTFYDGVTVLGSKALSGGSASLSTIALQSGTQNLRAYYSGVTSAAVPETVKTVGSVTFTPASAGSGSPYPYKIIAADFNNDGKADLAVLSYSSVAVLLGDGNGGFSVKATYSVGDGFDMAAGDFNGDGIPDLVVAGVTSGILFGNGDGTFTSALGQLMTVQTVNVADFNGDGFADLLVTESNNSTYAYYIDVLLGHGDGTFTLGTQISFTGPIAIGDFNGDGKADFAQTFSPTQVNVYLGYGDGTFGPPSAYSVGPAGSSGIIKLATVDVNGDGKADLIQLSDTGFGVALGNGDGTFKSPTAVLSGSPAGFAFADFNGDGKLDVLVESTLPYGGNSIGNYFVFPGNGDGTFGSATFVHDLNAGYGVAIGNLAIGDFNGDGRADIATPGSSDGTVDLLLGSQTPALFAFVGDVFGGATRNNFGGNVGMRFSVGSNPITVKALGRYVIAGNNQVHQLTLVAASSGTTVATAQVNTLGAASSLFQYGALATPVVLPANTSYYLVSQEYVGGDQWLEYGYVSATGLGTIDAPVYQQANGVFISLPFANESYVPVNLLALPGTSGNFVPPSVSIATPANGTTVKGVVTLTATASSNTVAPISSVQFQIGPYFLPPLTAPPYTSSFDTSAFGNGSQPLITATATDASYNSASASVTVTVDNGGGGASPTPFITSAPSGTSLRNNYSGFVGMEFTVGSSPISVSSLGRWVVPGNKLTHIVKLVNAATGADVAGGSVNLVLSAFNGGQYAYAALANPVTLLANTAYIVVSQEASGGDQWNEFGAVNAAPGGVVNGPIYADAAGRYVLVTLAQPSQGYVPANFQFTGAGVVPPTIIPYLTGSPNAPLRNNYTGFVGMEIKVGGTPVVVNQLGRWVTAGSSQTHLLKLVNATSGLDVSGGSVSLAANGAQGGQFQYASLPGTVQLAANTAYYLVSQEFAGGDVWFDYGPVFPASVAGVAGPVYSDAAGKFVVLPQFPGDSYVPITFGYSSPPTN